MINTKTIELTANIVSKINFDKKYPYIYIKNFGDTDVYASELDDIAPDKDGVTRISSGTVGLIYRDCVIDDVYVMSSNNCKIEIIGAYDANLSFNKLIMLGGEKYDDTELKNEITGKEDKSNKVTSISETSTDTEYPSAKAVYDSIINKVDKVSGKGLSTNDYTTTEKNKLANAETKSNKVTSISKSSTDNQYPSAKAVFDLVGSGANNSKFAWGIVNFPDDSSTTGEYTTWHDSTPVTVTLDFQPSVVILISQFSLNDLSSLTNTAYSFYFQNKTYKNGKITNNGFNFKYDVLTIKTGLNPTATHNRLSYIKPEDDVIYIALGT